MVFSDMSPVKLFFEVLHLFAVNVPRFVVAKTPNKCRVYVIVFFDFKLFTTYKLGVILNGVFASDTLQKQLRQSCINIVNDKMLIFSR